MLLSHTWKILLSIVIDFLVIAGNYQKKKEPREFGVHAHHEDYGSADLWLGSGFGDLAIKWYWYHRIGLTSRLQHIGSEDSVPLVASFV